MQTQRGFAGVGILVAIVLGVVVLGGGAYFVMQQKSTSQTTSDIPDTAMPTNTQVLSETKTQTGGDTQTKTENQSYVSKEMGISFNYPKSWKAEYKKGRDGKQQILLTSPDFQAPVPGGTSSSKGEMINIEFGASWIAGPESEKTTAQEYVNQKMDFYTKNPLSRAVIQQISFKNQPAFLKRTLTGPGIGAAWTVYDGKEFSVTYFFSEWTSTQESRFSTVTSNLAFFAPTVANTQTVSGASSGSANLHYKNSTLGIAFDYPSMWLVSSEKDTYGKETVILKTNDFLPAQSSAQPLKGTQIRFSFDQNSSSMAGGDAKEYAESEQESAAHFYTMVESKIIKLGSQYAFFKRVDGGVFTIKSAYESRYFDITGTFVTWSPEVEKAVNQMISTFSFE